MEVGGVLYDVVSRDANATASEEGGSEDEDPGDGGGGVEGMYTHNARMRRRRSLREMDVDVVMI